MANAEHGDHHLSIDWEKRQRQLSGGVDQLDALCQSAFHLKDVSRTQTLFDNGHSLIFLRSDDNGRIYYEFSINLGAGKKGSFSLGQKSIDNSDFAIINFPGGPNEESVEALEPIGEWLRDSFEQIRKMPRTPTLDYQDPA